MLTDRQKMIFKAIVDEFVRTAEPVGSKTLVERYHLNYSTATIRNEMNYLEQEGLLEKTHTSSGRVPSTAGYRYYVENLMNSDLTDEEKHQLEVVSNTSAPLEEIIQRSCEVLSNMTNLTAVVLGPNAKQQRLAHIRLFPLDEHSAVAVFITDQGHTENKIFRFADSVSVDDLEKCTQVLNDRLAGTPIDETVEKMNELKPILANTVKRHEALFNAFMNAFQSFASDNVFYSGASNLMDQPEFDDVDKMRALMRNLENADLWHSLAARSDKLALTDRDSRDELVWTDDMAVVSSKFTIGAEEGRLMVVGPARMDYNRIVSALNFAAKLIEAQYKKRFKDK